MTVISDHRGRVRGYVADLPRTRRHGTGSSTSGPRSAGVLAVVRYHPTWRELYTGIVPLVSGGVAADLAHYLVTSEQTPSALAAGGSCAATGRWRGGRVSRPGLPGADENVLSHLERTVRELPTPTELIRGGSAPTADGALLAGLGAGSHSPHPEFFCACDTGRSGEPSCCWAGTRRARSPRPASRRRPAALRDQLSAGPGRGRRSCPTAEPRWKSRCSFPATSTSWPRA